MFKGKNDMELIKSRMSEGYYKKVIIKDSNIDCNIRFLSFSIIPTCSQNKYNTLNLSLSMLSQDIKKYTCIIYNCLMCFILIMYDIHISSWWQLLLLLLFVVCSLFYNLKCMGFQLMLL